MMANASRMAAMGFRRGSALSEPLTGGIVGNVVVARSVADTAWQRPD
ncbi:hypothetical protein EDC48_101103 [Gibbsiella quercinecans]|nr:hypothetical protein [Gibbsiella quercinecans]TCT92299.1 hypothetical protein EDC48_101103 [Gibbsiella quercinecans]